MQVLRCPQCGAEISLDTTKEFGYCSFCGTAIQLNETVIHKHEGGVSIEGLSTLNSLIEQGIMEARVCDFKGAYQSFKKAQAINAKGIDVMVGLMLFEISDSNAELYHKQVKENDQKILEIEKEILTKENASFILGRYCYLNDMIRCEYVAEKYPKAVDCGLVLSENRFKLDGTIKPISERMDLIGFLCKYNVSVKLIFQQYINDSLDNYSRFVTYMFPPIYLERLLSLGLRLTDSVHFKISRAEEYSIRSVKDCILVILSRDYEFCTGPEEKYEKQDYIDVLKKFGYIDANQKQNRKKDGCYVATAVYGSYDCSEVWTLRCFRDDTLAKTWYGRAFIHIYYAISPTLVKLFGKTEWFKNMWKPKLDKLVKDLNEKGMKNTPYKDKQW